MQQQQPSRPAGDPGSGTGKPSGASNSQRRNGKGGSGASSGKLPHISVTELTPVKRRGLKAFASVRIGRLVLHQWRICDDGRQTGLYVLPPSSTWTEPVTDPKTGKGGRRTCFRSLVDVPADWTAAVSVAVLKAWDRADKNPQREQASAEGRTV